MEIDITTTIKALAPPAIKGIFSILKDHLDNDHSDKNDIQINLENHICEVIRWSEQIQFFEMHKPNYTDESTISLLYGIPRKFRSKQYNATEDENSILTGTNNLLILGDPGAGKTTTLKRLARRMFLAPPVSHNDIYQIPILIKLRDINDNIYNHIAKTLGLKIRSEPEIDHKLEREEYIELEYFIGNDHIDIAIPKILNNCRALILIDGLDEVSYGRKTDYEKEIVSLGNQLSTSKIILTCRSGEYTNIINGFSIIEICPLDEKQTDDIINKWSSDPENFKTTLQKYPYFDISNRPLFLNQLIITHNYYGDLPSQPSEIYERIINLMLIQWDKHKNVKRKSNYSNFHSEKKLKFLSAISYELTYKIKSKTFTSNDLISAYYKIHTKFSLPENEAELVVQEIESHTGIISKTTDNKYEFSHLSLQEFLCALYIVREPIGQMSIAYLKEFPHPVSIAIALSSSPELFMANIILRDSSYDKISKDSLLILLTRLFVEQPLFSISDELGFTFIKLLISSLTDNLLANILLKFVDNSTIGESICKSLQWYTVEKRQSTNALYYINRIHYWGSKLDIDINIPKCGFLPKEIIDKLLYRSNFELIEDGEYLNFRSS